MKRLTVLLVSLLVLVTVFWLKVEHAIGVCAEAGGHWADGDCLFEERPKQDDADGAHAPLPR